MKIRSLTLALLTAVLLALSAPKTFAQSMPPSGYPQVVPYAPNAGGIGGHRWSLFGRFRGSSAAAGSQGGMPSSSGTNAPGTRGLPRGRRYYNGRFFGDFNNRFYSPQYGYF
jgi:hypothetical protein